LVEFLRFCKQTRQPATVASARQFMAEMETQRRLSEAELARWKGAVNWFFRAARAPIEGLALDAPSPRSVWAGVPAGNQSVGASPPVGAGPTMSGVPTLGAADLGKTEWEQRLIRELRRRNYRWRTEQTCEPVEGCELRVEGQAETKELRRPLNMRLCFSAAW
jgi:hypothetical protein